MSPSSSFVVIYKLSTKLDSWNEITMTGSKKHYIIQNLTPWTSYDVRVIFKEGGLQSTSNVLPYLVSDTGNLIYQN